MKQAKARVPNRGSFTANDPRINRNGRPRSGLALAERIRERMSPDELIDLVTKALADESIPIRERVAFAFQLAAHGYTKPPAGLDINPSATDGPDLSRATDEQLRAALAALEAPNQGTEQPLVTSGTGDCSTSVQQSAQDAPVNPPGAGGGGNGTYDRMVAAGIPATSIPGFANVMTFLARYSANASTIPPLGFEVSTYSGATLGQVGVDANPVTVLIAILTDRFGKLGLDFLDVIDNASFVKAAETLSAEGHGYSRAFAGGETAQEMIDDVLRHIDGVLYEEPRDGRLYLRLIRADYDPNAALEVTPSTCDQIEGYETGWGPATVNKLSVKYPRRTNQYQTDIAPADNMANVDSVLSEVSLEFLGCTTAELASAIAARELAARTRPLAKCRATCTRDFWNTRPGDVVRVTWPEYSVSGKMFRVADVHRGGPDSNAIVLDLIEDFFYVHRGFVLPETGLHGGGTPPILDPSP
jgi:hypothetical protein